MAYTWGYIRNATLAKLDLTETEANTMNLLNRFTTYANEVITQVCSSIKPKINYFTFTVFFGNSIKEEIIDDVTVIRATDVQSANIGDKYLDTTNGNTYSCIVAGDSKTSEWKFENKQVENNEYNINITADDFISFGGGINTVTYKKFAGTPFEKAITETAYNDILTFSGYNTITVKISGTYKIWYNARWIDFSMLYDAAVINVYNDIDKVVLNVPNDILDCIPSYIAAQCYGIDDEYKAAKYRNEFEILLARIDNRTADNSGTFKIGGDW